MITEIVLISVIIVILIYAVKKQLKEHYAQQDPMIQLLKVKLRNLHPNVSNTKVMRGNKSYTINKKKIYLCLYDDQNRYYDENMLTYVYIHELAHTLCDEQGHTKKFMDIFSQLLGKAEWMGLYNPSIAKVKNYCGYKN